MRGRLRALDGLRGLLALYILAAHTAPFLGLPASAACAVWTLSHGRGAVELFFVLSGMVIMRSILRGTGEAFPSVSAREFMLARAGRLLPVYAIALAVAAIALSCGDPFQALPWLAGNVAARNIAEGVWPQPWLAHMAAHITLTQGILPPALLPDVEFTVLGPAWSLSTEWQFYLVVAAILAFRQRRQTISGGDWPSFAAAMMGVGAAGLLADLLPAEWQPGRAFLPHEAWYFALGIASHGFLVSGRTRAALWWVLSLAAAVLVQWQQNPLTAAVVPLLWTACLICEGPRAPLVFRPLAAALHSAPLQWLAGISYPLYLIHLPLQRLMLLALAPAVGARAIAFSLLWGPAAILVPLLAAYGLHRWVEVPCWRWSRRRAHRVGTGKPHLAEQQGLLFPEGSTRSRLPIDGG